MINKIYLQSFDKCTNSVIIKFQSALRMEMNTLDVLPMLKRKHKHLDYQRHRERGFKEFGRAPFKPEFNS